MLDTTYDKNKIAFNLLTEKLESIYLENPQFDLYLNNSMVESRTIIKKPAEMSKVAVKLSQYRNYTNLFKEHPESSRFGYMNIHNINPFKARELLDKFLIEREVNFKAPRDYF